MPVVPDISLGVVHPDMGGSNPLATVGSAVDIANKIQQNQLLRNQALIFQQELAAKQKAGQIIASSPDDATAQTRLQADPQVMAFHPEITGTIRANQTALLENQHRLQDMSSTALEGVYKGLAPALDDPSQFENSWSKGIATIPKSVRDYLRSNSSGADPLKTLHDTLGPLAKSDPDGFRKQIAAGMLTALPPDRVFAAGGAVAPALTQTAGGGLRASGGFGSGVSMPQNSPQTSIPGALPPSRLAADGTQLPAPDSALPHTPVDNAGFPLRDPAHQKSVEDQLDRFNKDQPNYDMSAQASARLDEVGENIQTLAKGGGLLTPGAGGSVRAGLANAVNTVSSIFSPGSPPPIDVSKVAASQAAMKDTINLGFQLAHQMFGGGREPLGIVNNALAAVPGIDNTPLGAMLVKDTLKAGTDWMADQRLFKQDWAARAHNDLTGADTKFATSHKPIQYLQPVLDKYGLGSEGFKSVDNVASAYRDGLINGKIAADEMLKKGWISKDDYASEKAAGFPDAFGRKATP